ncbi:hypothetical protein K439DRAFT_1360055 [Ramaria rubella]|nr:hypothetical protein K439DRAFT_1360055 [Ramaria rubella]
MTFPSALTMIVQQFPDSTEQSHALAIFGAFGALGNVIGFVLGGVLTARVNWRWTIVFYVVAIMTLPFSILSVFTLLKHSIPTTNRARKLDWQGVVALGGGLGLFVYAEGNDVGPISGWAKPQIIVTLTFSVLFVVGFFFIECYVEDPAFEFSIYWFLNSSELQLIQVFQDLWGWSALSAALHCLPIRITGGNFGYLTGIFAPYMPRRILLISGQVLMLVGTILFALTDTPDKYWSHILPGMIIGMIDVAVAYVGANIFIIVGAQKGEEVCFS